MRRIGEARRIAWVAFDDDQAFARTSAGVRFRLAGETGQLVTVGFWRRLWERAGVSEERV